MIPRMSLLSNLAATVRTSAILAVERDTIYLLWILHRTRPPMLGRVPWQLAGGAVRSSSISFWPSAQRGPRRDCICPLLTRAREHPCACPITSVFAHSQQVGTNGALSIVRASCSLSLCATYFACLLNFQKPPASINAMSNPDVYIPIVNR